MWTGSIQLSKIMLVGRWKVELYAESSDKNNDIKYNFPMVALGELFQESRLTKDPQLTPNAKFNYIGMENIESQTGDIVGDLKCSGIEIKSRSKIVQNDNILYGRLRPNLNKVYWAKNPSENTICSGEFLVLTPLLEKVRPRVLKELLSSQLVLTNVIKFIGGAALPRVPLSDLKTIKVPLPPLERQLEFERVLLISDDRRKEIKRELHEMPTMLHDHLNTFFGLNEAVEADL